MSRYQTAGDALDDFGPRALEIFLRDYLMNRAQSHGDVEHREQQPLESFVLDKWEFIINDVETE